MQPIDHDGIGGMPEIFDFKRLETLLEKPEVKEVKVFRLKKGMKINIGNIYYKVTAVRSNGKITIKMVK